MDVVRLSPSLIRSYTELKSAIADALGPNPGTGSLQAALASLQRLGFVWCPQVNGLRFSMSLASPR